MPSRSFASQIADIVTRFLVQSQEVSVQVHRLVVVKQLWSVMKNVFATSWLPAEKIVASVIKVNFFLEEEHIKAAWSDLCSDLISVGIPTLLHVMSTGSEGQKVTRQLWTVLARTWQVPDEKAHWDELISFLAIPLKSWIMFGVEINLWEGVLRSSMSMAHFDSVKPLMVMDRFLRRLGDNGTNRLVAFPQGVSALLAYIDLSGCTALPQDIIAVIDRTLFSNYPPRGEFLAACLEIIRHVGKMLAAVPRVLLVQLLTSAQKGICCWIGDEKAAMLTMEHDIVARSRFYPRSSFASILLRELPPSLETLIAISPFLSSAFGRLSSSAIGPLSFSEYWRGSYHGIEEYTPSYPDCLRACLLGYSDAFGGSIAEGLSMSQGTDLSPIPDSQPFYLGGQKTWFSRESWQPSSGQHPVKPKKLPSPNPLVECKRLEGPSRVKKTVTPLEPPALTQVSFDRGQSVVHQLSERIPPSQPLIPSYNGSVEESSVHSAPRLTPRLLSSKDCVLRKRSSRAVHEARLPKSRKTQSDLDLDRYFSQSVPRDLHNRGHTGPPLQIPASSQISFHSLPAVPRPASSTARHCPDPPPSPEVSLGSYSQSTATRKHKRVADWLNSFEALQNSGPRSNASQVSSSGSSSPMYPGTAMKASTLTSEVEEEYDTWEAGAASLQEIMELQRELVGSDNFVPETDEEEFEAGTDDDSDLEDFLSRSRPAISGSRLEPDQTPPK
ncbi:hypothetical protein C0992_009973 [Termitomyces sp. T32_za158]|nr:hypothetical protein C0992_009973 [Termitomyces sp. T32_za158]